MQYNLISSWLTSVVCDNQQVPSGRLVDPVQEANPAHPVPSAHLDRLVRLDLVEDQVHKVNKDREDKMDLQVRSDH